MADTWFCRIAGQEIGPLTAAQLRAMAANGRLMPSDPVRQGQGDSWLPAGAIQGLFVLKAEGVPVRSAKSPPVAQPLAEKGPSVPPPMYGKDASPGDPFSFLEESGSPAAPLPAATAPATLRPARSKRNERLFVTVLLSLLGVLTALLIVLGVVVSWNARKPLTNLATAARETAKNAKTDDEIWSTKKETPLPQAGSQIQWLVAGRDTWKAGEATVQIVKAEVKRPTLYRLTSKPAGRTKEEFLVVTLQIANSSETLKLDYPGWSDRGLRPKLRDDLGNDYAAATFSTGYTVEGQPAVRSVYPGKSVTDVLVFPPPVGRAKYLQLELPGGGMKVSGTGYFHIPMTMLVQLPEPPPEEPKKEPAAAEEDRAAEAKADDATSADQQKNPPNLDLKRQ